MKDWNESSTIKLIGAVQKVEDNWGAQKWDDPGEKWLHIAAELPELQSSLEIDAQEFPDFCKAGFAKICRYFNEIFTKAIKHISLTQNIIVALEMYSLTLNHDEYFPLIGHKTHFRPIILVDINEISSEESDTNCSDGVSSEFEEDKLNQDSKTSEDLMATATTSNLEERKDRICFRIKVEDFHLSLKGGLVRIPRGYCDKYMPRRHPAVLTCIRDGKQYQLKYLPHKRSLSAGWKNFCRSNALQAQDEVIFFRLDISTYEVKILGKDAQPTEGAGPGNGIHRRTDLPQG